LAEVLTGEWQDIVQHDPQQGTDRLMDGARGAVTQGHPLSSRRTVFQTALCGTACRTAFAVIDDL